MKYKYINVIVFIKIHMQNKISHYGEILYVKYGDIIGIKSILLRYLNFCKKKIIKYFLQAGQNSATKNKVQYFITLPSAF